MDSPNNEDWMFEDADTETAPPQWVTMRPVFVIRVSVVTTEDAA